MKTMKEFLKELEGKLYFFSEDEIEQILLDYEDLYEEKLSQGQTEEEIMRTLDSPAVIAQQYANELGVKTSIIEEKTINAKKFVTKKYKEHKAFESEVKAKKREKKQEKESTSLMEIVIDVIKFVIKVVKQILKFVIKLVEQILIILITISIAVAFSLYILSFVFLRLNEFANLLRICETLALISYTGMGIIVISMLRGKNE